MIKRFTVFGWLIFLLAGCSVMPEKPVGEYNLATMQGMTRQRLHWAFEGRLAVTDGKDSLSVSVVWRHNASRDDIELVGPLAQGRVKIALSGQQVAVDDGEHPRVFYGEPDKVVAEQLGVDIPISAFRYWVLGVNEPGLPFVEQPNGFYQGGWLVTYREMQRVETDLLPKKIAVQKDKTRIKLIVDQWDLS